MQLSARGEGRSERNLHDGRLEKQCFIGLWKKQMRVSRKKHGRES